VHGHDAARRLSELEAESQRLASELAEAEAAARDLAADARLLGLAPPATAASLPAFAAVLAEALDRLDAAAERGDEQHGAAAAERSRLDRELRDAERDVAFLASHRTRIDARLYGVKQRLVADLGLAPGLVDFVGELVELTPAGRAVERAVESALRPVARLLLVHPDCLDAVTRWLDANRLEADVAAKRIRPSELAAAARPAPIPGGVLETIRVKPADATPFHHYVWRLLQPFDLRIVDTREFARATDKVVTPEGLVKTDAGTMRKHRHDFGYSLGWDNEAQRQAAHARKAELQAELAANDGERQRLARERRAHDALRAAHARLAVGAPGFAAPGAIAERLAALEDTRTLLGSGVEAAGHAALLADADAARVAKDRAEVAYHEARAELHALPARIAELAREADKARASYERYVAERGLTHLSAPSVLEAAMHAFAATLAQYKLDVAQLLARSDRERAALDREGGEASARAARHLADYRREHDDPDVHYALESLPLDALAAEWRAKRDELVDKRLVEAEAKWRRFFDDALVDAVASAIDELRRERDVIASSIRGVNSVLAGTLFETIGGREHFIQIAAERTKAGDMLDFEKQLRAAEAVVRDRLAQPPGDAAAADAAALARLEAFVDGLRDPVARERLTDARNHFAFSVRNLRREHDGATTLVETLQGHHKDGKSGGQTVQVAYTVMAAAVAHRFKFADPLAGRDTPRLLILDEFADKLDNERPLAIVRLLRDMGFQTLFILPMAKAELILPHVQSLVLVHKRSETSSRLFSIRASSRAELEGALVAAARPPGSSRLAVGMRQPH
jgi:uncharacterized protein YPO0396